MVIRPNECPKYGSIQISKQFQQKLYTSGGSCIFTRNTIQTKEVNYLRGLGSEKVFEMSAVELSDSGPILACIYRSSDSDLYEFLLKLELLITKVHSKGTLNS